ncbi:MAG: ThuA domain-containing protein [Actinomycetota bacterium]
MLLSLLASGLASAAGAPASSDLWLTLPGVKGPGKGKKVVLIAGDQEYRSEEVLTQFARILSQRHGFDCTVLYCIDPTDGTINPNINNIPGLEKLKDADLLVIFMRWLDLPDAQIKPILDYVDSGRPLVALRTSTHPFKLSSPTYRRYTWDSKEPGFEGGFGKVVLGETWYVHHGDHGKQGTRGIVAPGQEAHPIVRGIEPGSIFGPTDVYGIRMPLPGDSTPVVLGQVTETLEPTSAPVAAKNSPMMPIAWTRTYMGLSGKPGRVFTSTIGASQDFAYEGTRRLLVNGVYWAAGLEKKIPARSNVALVGKYEPTPFRFKKSEDWRPGIRPADLLK